MRAKTKSKIDPPAAAAPGQPGQPAPERPPTVTTEPRLRGEGWVAMVFQNGVLERVEFGQNEAETAALALAAVGSLQGSQ